MLLCYEKTTSLFILFLKTLHHNTTQILTQHEICRVSPTPPLLPLSLSVSQYPQFGRIRLVSNVGVELRVDALLKLALTCEVWWFA